MSKELATRDWVHSLDGAQMDTDEQIAFLLICVHLCPICG
jgi:hypothetical protein